MSDSATVTRPEQFSSVSGYASTSWLGAVDLQPIVTAVGTPTFIYSEEQLLRNVRRIRAAARSAGLEHRVELYIPFFPNANPHVLKSLQDAGAGLLLQLPAEHKILTKFGFDKFIVSPGHVSDSEISFWAGKPYPVFLSSLDEVRFAIKANTPSISVRIDSLDSGKPGVKLPELAELSDLLTSHDRDLESFEVYCGSGNSREDMAAVVSTMFQIYQSFFPTVRSINFAGGHGFSYEHWHEEKKHFDWHEYLRAIQEISERFSIPEHVKFLFEPARDVLADTGALLLQVKRDIIRNPFGNIVVTDGSRMLMPSAQLRDRRHHVVFFDATLSEIQPADAASGCYATVRGRTILRHDYILPGEYWVPQGTGALDFMAILDVGAYCATQHMEFLNVPPAAEVMIDLAGVPQLISAAGDELDRWRNLLDERTALPQ